MRADPYQFTSPSMSSILEEHPVHHAASKSRGTQHLCSCAGVTPTHVTSTYVRAQRERGTRASAPECHQGAARELWPCGGRSCRPAGPRSWRCPRWCAWPGSGPASSQGPPPPRPDPRLLRPPPHYSRSLCPSLQGGNADFPDRHQVGRNLRPLREQFVMLLSATSSGQRLPV